MTTPEPTKDPRYVQIADALRRAIDGGEYQPGDRLPTQAELADRHEVTRETVKRALELLEAERRITTRQGSGSYVRVATARATGLRPHLQAAFEGPRVAIDFLGFTAETLAGALIEPLNLVREGKLQPESIALRLIVSDMEHPVPLPSRASGGTDDAEVRARESRIIDRSVQTLRHAVDELPGATCEVKALAAPPLLKLYLVNGTEAWFGFYEVVTRSVQLRGGPVDIFDVLGKDSTLFPYTTSDDDGAAWVASAQRWFDSWWDNIARDYEP